DNDNDPDIPFTANSNNLVVNDGSMLLLFDNGTTATSYAPGGTINISVSTDGTDSVVDGDLTIQSGATLTMGTNALSIGGDYSNTGNLSGTPTQTTTFTATASGFSESNIGAGDFDALNFNGSGGDW